MRKEYIVNLNEISKMTEFNKEVTYQLESEVDVLYGRYIIDAKSLMGLMSLAGNDVKVVIYSDDEEEIKMFGKICRKYEVRK